MSLVDWRFKTALDEWTKSVSELATWIRYSPPPSGAKPVEPSFDDQSEDDDDSGPETTHCLGAFRSPRQLLRVTVFSSLVSAGCAYNFSAPSILPRLRSNVPSGR
jgi:hypothetical protein